MNPFTQVQREALNLQRDFIIRRKLQFHTIAYCLVSINGSAAQGCAEYGGYVQ